MIHRSHHCLALQATLFAGLVAIFPAMTEAQTTRAEDARRTGAVRPGTVRDAAAMPNQGRQMPTAPTGEVSRQSTKPSTEPQISRQPVATAPSRINPQQSNESLRVPTIRERIQTRINPGQRDSQSSNPSFSPSRIQSTPTRTFDGNQTESNSSFRSGNAVRLGDGERTPIRNRISERMDQRRENLTKITNRSEQPATVGGSLPTANTLTPIRTTTSRPTPTSSAGIEGRRTGVVRTEITNSSQRPVTNKPTSMGSSNLEGRRTGVVRPEVGSTGERPSMAQGRPATRPAVTGGDAPSRPEPVGSSLGAGRRTGLVTPGESGNRPTTTQGRIPSVGSSTTRPVPQTGNAAVGRPTTVSGRMPVTEASSSRPVSPTGDRIVSPGLARGNQATFTKANSNLQAMVNRPGSTVSGASAAALIGAAANVSALPASVSASFGNTVSRPGTYSSLTANSGSFSYLSSVRPSTTVNPVFTEADLRSGNYVSRPGTTIISAPSYFRPVVQPYYVNDSWSRNDWMVPSSSISVSYLSGRSGFSWTYYDGRCNYDQVYVSALLSPMGIVPVGGYDGVFIGNRYYAHGYGYLDGCLYYGSGRIWVPGFWAPQSTRVCNDTYEWIPAQYDWVWTGYDWEWLVVDGGYYVTRSFAECDYVTRWAWIPGHWQRAYRG